MSLKRTRPVSPSSEDASDHKQPKTVHHDVWISPKIEDRESIFQAYFSPTMPARQLQSQSDIDSATHRILAWRVPSSQSTLLSGPNNNSDSTYRTVQSGSDDDGEKMAGKRALQVLQDMRVQGSLVVARWYGGIMLGPVRFTHIEICAREAISSWQREKEQEVQKKRKIENEAAEKNSLVTELENRDESIRVLRSLLQEKTKLGQVDQQQQQQQKTDGTNSSPARAADYSSMTVERLRMLDKSRDNTIAFLLKKIDEAEVQNKVKTAAKDDKAVESTNNQDEPKE